MAVTGGSQALAAVREGIAHLRSVLADAGLDLGDVALRPDAVQAPAPASGSAASADGQASANGPRPDRGAQGADAGDRRPGQRHDQGPATGPDRPDAVRPPRARHSPDALPEGPAGIRRLDVRV
jgi:hypothetical protein